MASNISWRWISLMPIRHCLIILLIPTILLACSPVPAPVAAPAPGQRLLSLDFPTTIRAGDTDVVYLTLELDTSGNLTATAQSTGNAASAQTIQIPNVYDTHNILAESRLEMAGVIVRPDATVSEPLLPGQKVIFFWSLQPLDVGTYRGRVWFYLRFVPKNGGDDTRVALSAMEIELESRSFFGLSASVVRWLGLGGIFISVMLGLPLLVDALRRSR